MVLRAFNIVTCRTSYYVKLPHRNSQVMFYSLFLLYNILKRFQVVFYDLIKYTNVDFFTKNLQPLDETYIGKSTIVKYTLKKIKTINFLTIKL